MQLRTKKDSEKAIERKLSGRLKEVGGQCYKLLSTHVTGLPDRLCLFPSGIAVFVELKSTGERPRKIQIIRHNQIRSIGFRVEVIDSLKGVDDFINDMKGIE